MRKLKRAATEFFVFGLFAGSWGFLFVTLYVS